MSAGHALGRSNPSCLPGPSQAAGRLHFRPFAMTRSNRTDHIRLTSHPDPGAKHHLPIHWGAESARQRGLQRAATVVEEQWSRCIRKHERCGRTRVPEEIRRTRAGGG